MTQKDLAKKLGISREYLNGILRGKLRGSIRLCEKISEETGRDFFSLRPDLKEIIRKHF